MSFDPKNKADKAKLYPVLKALADLDPRKTPELIMDDAVGYPVARGQDYVRNMRRGEIAVTYATLIHQWLTEHHFELARRLAPEIFPETPEQRWQAIVDERAISDRFRLVLVLVTMGIVERESHLKPADTIIRLGERFCFELDGEADGYAIAMQSVRGQWHNIPLGPNGRISAPIQSGQNRLPIMQDGKLDPLRENNDEGVHEFILITAQTADFPSSLTNLISWAADSQCKLHRVTVKFVA
ncbi:hypothetical protein [Phaeobacter sp. 11ANDIMAR09]|uniref:hypothetical protein n=1 Tax=Phaeobacter sp. 11ANDIMAR09 TaxID=1225647 RepID=UPI0006C87F9D|nr:hypothetical protein [Phaeobacter sp. 11ANDIMAR09]KPD12642.1 hypothetical protein AN476_08690 [Phaeobacter sp. 11ANDIMAR09]